MKSLPEHKNFKGEIKVKSILKKATVMALTLAVGMSLVAGCGSDKKADKAAETKVEGKISASGSTALLPLLKVGQEEFYKKHDKVTINLSGGGSFTGQKQAASGSVDIGNSDVALADDLKDKGMVETKLVGIPFVFIANKDVPVDNLSAQQYVDILTGKIKNWKEVGGADADIKLYGRENSSGTYTYFKDVVLKGKDFAAQTQTLPGTAAVVNAVAKDKYGIGYGGAAYAKGVKFAKLKKDDASSAFEPSLETVRSGDYPLSRFLFWYLRSKPQGDIKKLVDFVLSPQGQDVVTKVGYFPVK